MKFLRCKFFCNRGFRYAMDLNDDINDELLGGT